MEDPVEVIALPGFDPEGDPEIQRMKDGSLWLVFNFMPPSWAPEEEYADLGRCQDFDKRLEAAIGVPVLWDDREFFLIKRPRQDTLAAIQKFLADFRKTHDRTAHGP
ncbi:MAG TPA: hypothetical protein VFA26_26380 [Gemmataceae bacterium]|nr:hypothetical protein [Gemmataceae bacterium]